MHGLFWQMQTPASPQTHECVMIRRSKKPGYAVHAQRFNLIEFNVCFAVRIWVVKRGCNTILTRLENIPNAARVAW